MEYLVISDIHLRNKLEPKKMNFLMNLIKNYQNIILNGDFYEARYTNAENFLKGKYKPLIDLLRSKNTYYIFGNHDPEYKSKKVADYITNKQFQFLKIQIGDTKFHIEHGHRLGFEEDAASDLLFHVVDTISYLIQKYFNFLVVILGSKWNSIIKKHRRFTKLIEEFEILVVGHTHVKSLELKERFVNGGYIKYGRGSYLVISDDKSTQLKQVKY